MLKRSDTMPNEIIWILFALLNFGLLLAAYKLFGKTGLFAWMALGTFIANLQVIKTVEIFTMVATLGNIMYGTLFLVTDALGEKYGKKDANKAVYLGFFALIASTLIMQGALLFVPHASDWAQPHLEAVFSIVFVRIVVGSLVAYIVSQLIDVHVFYKIKQKLPNDKFLWIRNNGSTMISQLIDTSIFVSIAFIGTMDFSIVISIFITTYLIKLLVASLDTPFIYLIKKMKPLGE